MQICAKKYLLAFEPSVYIIELFYYLRTQKTDLN